MTRYFIITDSTGSPVTAARTEGEAVYPDMKEVDESAYQNALSEIEQITPE